MITQMKVVTEANQNKGNITTIHWELKANSETSDWTSNAGNEWVKTSFSLTSHCLREGTKFYDQSQIKVKRTQRNPGMILTQFNCMLLLITMNALLRPSLLANVAIFLLLLKYSSP